MNHHEQGVEDAKNKRPRYLPRDWTQDEKMAYYEGYEEGRGTRPLTVGEAKARIAEVEVQLAELSKVQLQLYRTRSELEAIEGVKPEGYFSPANLEKLMAKGGKSRFYDTLNGRRLQDHLRVEITGPDDSCTKRVIYHSRIHVNRTAALPVCFSGAFSDYQILRDSDVINGMECRYGDIYTG